LPAPLPISALRLTQQGSVGEVLSALSGEGRIDYVEADDQKAIDVKPGDYVLPDNLQQFYIRRIGFQPEVGAIRLVAAGLAGSLKVGPAGAIRERTISWFDSVWQERRSIQLFALAAWLFPTTLAGYKLTKELRK
jgi:hypothetical protein